MTWQLSPVCKLSSRNVTKWQSLTFKCWLITQNLEPTQKFFGPVSGPIRKEEIQKLNLNQTGVSSVISIYFLILSFNTTCILNGVSLFRNTLLRVYILPYVCAHLIFVTLFVLFYFPSGSEQYVKYAYLCCFSLPLLTNLENIFLFVPGNRRFLKQFHRSRLTVRFCFGRSYSPDENTTIVSIYYSV